MSRNRRYRSQLRTPGRMLRGARKFWVRERAAGRTVVEVSLEDATRALRAIQAMFCAIRPVPGCPEHSVMFRTRGGRVDTRKGAT